MPLKQLSTLIKDCRTHPSAPPREIDTEIPDTRNHLTLEVSRARNGSGDPDWFGVIVPSQAAPNERVDKRQRDEAVAIAASSRIAISPTEYEGNGTVSALSKTPVCRWRHRFHSLATGALFRTSAIRVFPAYRIGGER